MVRHYLWVVAVLAALVAGPSVRAMASEAHSHATAGQGNGLTLDHGKKWTTDAPLRQGMAAIGGDLSGALDRIHHGRFSVADYNALAGSVEARIEGIARDCHLPEATDAQLHIVLAEIIDGVEVMRGKAGDRSTGAVAIIRALDRYQAHFDHPGWPTIRH